MVDYISDIKFIRSATKQAFGIREIKDAYELNDRDIEKTIEYLKAKYPTKTMETRELQTTINKKTKFWNTGKIICIVVSLSFLALFAVLIGLHIDDEDPWVVVMLILPEVVSAGCFLYALFPQMAQTDENTNSTISVESDNEKEKKRAYKSAKRWILFAFIIDCIDSAYKILTKKKK